MEARGLHFYLSGEGGIRTPREELQSSDGSGRASDAFAPKAGLKGAMAPVGSLGE